MSINQLSMLLEGADDVKLGISPDIVRENAQIELDMQIKSGIHDAWREKYDELRTTLAMPWRVCAYVAWLACPRARRTPRTQYEFADLIGLASDRVFVQWRRRYPIDAAVREMVTAIALDDIADVIAAMITVAKQETATGFNDRRMALTMAGAYDPRRESPEIAARILPPESQSDSELAQQAGWE